jgi:hypothetical protein
MLVFVQAMEQRVSRSRGCGPRRRRQRRWRTSIPLRRDVFGRPPVRGTQDADALDWRRWRRGRLATTALWILSAAPKLALRFDRHRGRTAFDEQHAALQWNSALPVQADESREVAFGEAVAVPGCRHAPVPLTNADGLQANSPGTLTIPTNRHAGVRTNLTRSRGVERWPFNDDRAFQCCVAWGTLFLNLLLRQQK